MVHTLFKVINERGRLSIFFFNKRIFSFHKDKNFFTKNFYTHRNILLNNNNFKKKTYKNIRERERERERERNILFVIPSLETQGGIENRLFQYANSLRESGIEPYFLCQYNKFEKILENFNVFSLYFYDSNFQMCFFDLLYQFKIDIVEFQFGSIDYFEKLNLLKLKKICRLGCTLHSQIKLPFQRIKYLDYSLCSFNHKELKFIPNGIHIRQIAWSFSGQRKALLISRLTKEKLHTIESFIDFCINNNVLPEIAGPLENYNAHEIYTILSLRYKNINIKFLGPVDTLSFLENHSKEYLFIGGVGQVILEAISLGYPAFVCSHFGVKYSSFLTSDNFETLRLHNFVIASCAGEISIDQTLPDNHYAQLPDDLVKKVSFCEIFQEYKKNL